MRDALLERVEREVLGWPEVWKKREEDGPGGMGVTGYRVGRRQVGHVHDDGHADFRFPVEVRGDLIRTGMATPHPAFPDSRTAVSYTVRTPDDVPKVLRLFRMSYERITASGPRSAATG